MANATFTTLLSAARRNSYGNVITTSLVHRSAGNHAAGSGSTNGDEAWLVRVQQEGMSTFYGRIFADKFAALDHYNARIGTVVAVAEVAA